MEKKDHKIILAPMAGITDLPFRLICKKFGADIVYSEMVSAAGLFYNGEKSKDLLKTTLSEQPVAVQLFGSNPEHFKKATKIVDKILMTNSQSSIKNQIDINFGCPVKKVMRQKAGCALMENSKIAREIIQTVTENTSLPVSIKIRAGIKKINALEFLGKIADLNWKTVIIHGRTYEQGFSGPIDSELIKKIKRTYPNKNIIANGGINTPEDAKNILKETNADGIAIGRGTLGNPWIFQQIKSYLRTNEYSKPDIEKIKEVALSHVRLFMKYKEEQNIKEIRKHLGWYFKNIVGAKNMRSELFEINNFDDISKIISNIK